MKAVDTICAWALFAWAFFSIVTIEIRHPAGAILDTPVLWIVIAILNVLRIRDAQSNRDLRLSCVAVSTIVLNNRDRTLGDVRCMDRGRHHSCPDRDNILNLPQTG
jgi:hypothetical protein